MGCKKFLKNPDVCIALGNSLGIRLRSLTVALDEFFQSYHGKIEFSSVWRSTIHATGSLFILIENWYNWVIIGGIYVTQ